MGSLADFIYFAAINDWIQKQITQFQQNIVQQVNLLVTGVAMALITLWILYQGFLLVSGKLREPAMELVLKAARIVVIVFVAMNASLFSPNAQSWLFNDLPSAINNLVTGETNTDFNSLASKIDENLAYTQVVMAAIDAVQITSSDIPTAQLKNQNMWIATLGSAGPSVVAGILLLMYQFAFALILGLGPLFIMCLIFDQTKSLFNRWLMYGLGTLFSMAMLYVVVSIVLKLTEGIALGLWTGDLLSKFVTGSTDGVEGITNQAMQQGGVGILMSMLLISIPPMAAMFFNGTLGNFVPYAQLGGGTGARPGPQGQPPGSYGSAPQPVNQSPNQYSAVQAPPPKYTESTPKVDDEIKTSRGTQTTEV